MGSWIQAPTAWTRINDGDAHDGNRKLGRTNAGTVYQSVAIPAGAVSAWFYCWEKTPSAPASTRLVITVCNTAGVVLDTLYDGPMGAAWTRHAADLTAHVGNTRWIYFQNMNATTCWIDDISVTWSYVSNSAVRLCVNDTTLAGRLRNTTDTVTLLSGNTIVDAVTYQSAWGGNNNDRTLERIRTLEDSMAPANWAEGPLNGTAGRINQAYLP
jgi:hypothetical protein